MSLEGEGSPPPFFFFLPLPAPPPSPPTTFDANSTPSTGHFNTARPVCTVSRPPSSTTTVPTAPLFAPPMIRTLSPVVGTSSSASKSYPNDGGGGVTFFLSTARRESTPINASILAAALVPAGMRGRALVTFCCFGASVSGRTSATSTLSCMSPAWTVTAEPATLRTLPCMPVVSTTTGSPTSGHQPLGTFAGGPSFAAAAARLASASAALAAAAAVAKSVAPDASAAPLFSRATSTCALLAAAASCVFRSRPARAIPDASFTSAASSAASTLACAAAIRGAVRSTFHRRVSARLISSSAPLLAVSNAPMVSSSVALPSPSAALASSTTAGVNPNRSAICNARDRPGTPHSSLYVGARAASSNSTAAFSKKPPGCSYLSALSSPWWVVARVRPARLKTVPPAPTPASRSSRAPPIAAPSAGDVPVPTSSISTNESGPAADKMALCFASLALNVERDCMRSCESPMSTSTLSNQGRRAISAGTKSPDRAIKLARPTAFIAAVLPPVLGPVMTTHRALRGTNTSTATGPLTRATSSSPYVRGSTPRLTPSNRSSSTSESSPRPLRPLRPSGPSSSPVLFFERAARFAASRRANRRARIACAASTGCRKPASSTSSSTAPSPSSPAPSPSSWSPPSPSSPR
mmetsp:Transcript_5340/g.21834  ORF Transcript_5340/g.21834 Transcript_5340/m.21834 type:complete len:638 (-) Transcript_5340:1184-3097(-)